MVKDMRSKNGLTDRFELRGDQLHNNQGTPARLLGTSGVDKTDLALLRQGGNYLLSNHMRRIGMVGALGGHPTAIVCTCQHASLIVFWTGLSKPNQTNPSGRRQTRS